MDNQQYEHNEARHFYAQLTAVEKAPLSDRQEARAEFRKRLENNLSHFEGAVCNLIAGNYGYGPYAYFKRLSKRFNRRAWLFVTVAAIEYGVSNKFAREVWKTLSPELQAAVDTVIDEAILSSESGD